MAGTTLDCKLTIPRAARTQFALATPADDPDIRRLLRENPMLGEIAVTLEREPNYFADAILPGFEKQTIIARESGRVVCMGHCSVHQRFVNGKPHRVGYLGGLRLDASVAGRFDILRRGYKFFHDLQSENPADLYFTSIASDNLPARKFLERGLPDMPAYEFISEFVTLLLPISRPPPVRNTLKVEPAKWDEALAFLQKQNSNYQIAESWTAQELMGLVDLGLCKEQFYCIRENGRIIATASICDQRSFKQTVIRGYSPQLTFARPAMNVVARLFGTPRLPPVGTAVANVFVCHLAAETKDPEALTALIATIGQSLSGKGIEFLTLGFASNDPRLALFRRRFRCREYSSRIYVVRWPNIGSSRHDLDERCLGLEVALL